MVRSNNSIHVLTLLIVFLFYSCDVKHDIYYRCSNLCITRRDFNATSYFYFGYRKDKDSVINDYIKAEYSGLTNSMDVYVFFYSNKRVEFVDEGGNYLEKLGNDSTMFVGKYSNYNWDKIFKRKKDSSLGYMRISNSIDLEKEWKNSGMWKSVTAIYNP